MKLVAMLDYSLNLKRSLCCHPAIKNQTVPHKRNSSLLAEAHHTQSKVYNHFIANGNGQHVMNLFHTVFETRNLNPAAQNNPSSPYKNREADFAMQQQDRSKPGQWIIADCCGERLGEARDRNNNNFKGEAIHSRRAKKRASQLMPENEAEAKAEQMDSYNTKYSFAFY